VLAVLVPLWGPTFDAVVRLAAQAMAALGDEAPRTPTRSRDDVLATAARLMVDAERVEAGRKAEQRPFGIEGRAWGARLRAERLRLDWLLGVPVDLADLVEHWRTTVELFGELGHGYEQARARARLALVLRATGDTEAAREEAAAAREYATRLGARPLLEELGGAARNETTTDLLTAREREILELVATGRSNGDIGQQLFISAKTVSVHVSNVMAKVGAASRTEAVALARQAGLLGG
jgi:DNA-binding CsgD family transcriptional regulator